MIYAYQSNQLEALAILAGHLMRAEQQAPYLERHVVLVQNQAIGHWLKLFLADQYHIQGNLTTALPAQFLWTCFPFEKILQGKQLCDKATLTWLLVEQLEHWKPQMFPRGLQALSLPNFNVADLNLRYQLALVLSDLYEEYLVYRPDWILAWESGKMPSELTAEEDAYWQAELWQQLWKRKTVRDRFYHRAHVAECAKKPVFRQFFQDQLSKRSHRPSIFLFGLFKLPVEQWQLLEILGETHTLYLFCHNASKAYSTEPVTLLNGEEIGLKKSHPLLEKLGAHKRIILHLLDHLNPHFEDLFIEPRGHTLLAHLQRSILTNEDYCKKPTEKQFKWNPSIDRSLTVQVAHTPLREVEQLHQALLYWMNSDPSLAPHEILILATDVELYAPFIEMLFTSTRDYPAIPVQVTSSIVGRSCTILDAWIKLLKTFNSRYTLEDVLDLLSMQCIGARYGIEPARLNDIEKTLKSANIRWSLNGCLDSSPTQQTEAQQNSWFFGIERMLLGYAMEEDAFPFRGRTPCPLAMGLETETIGNLAKLIDDLTIWQADLRLERAVQIWSSTLQSLISTFIQGKEEDLAYLENHVMNVLKPIKKVCSNTSLTWSFLSNLLLQAAEEATQKQPFLNGKAMFCSLLPLHTVPFRIIAILGLDEVHFPRRKKSYNFNCSTKYPRLGDRNPTTEDRQLLLDAIVSAKECLYLSYVGFSPQDNHSLLPATALLELISYLSNSVQLDEKAAKDYPSHASNESIQSVKNQLITVVPLSSFDANNFSHQYKWPNFSSNWFSTLWPPSSKQTHFVLANKKKSVERSRTLSVVQLKQFFAHPAKYFFAQHLRTYLPRFYPSASTEPFSWSIHEQQRFLKHWLTLWSKNEGWNDDQYGAWLAGSGVLPHGTVGKLYAERLNADWKDMIEVIQQHGGKPAHWPSPILVSKTIEEWHLQGMLNLNSQSGLLRYTVSELKHEDFWSFWIDTLCYYAIGGKAPVRLILSPNRIVEAALMSRKEAEADLLNLISRYQYSIERGDPIWLFPKASWTCVQATSYPKAENEIKSAWFGHPGQKTGEMHDPYLQALIGGDPMNFNRRVYGRIIEDTSKYLLPAYQKSGLKSD